MFRGVGWYEHYANADKKIYEYLLLSDKYTIFAFENEK